MKAGNKAAIVESRREVSNDISDKFFREFACEGGKEKRAFRKTILKSLRHSSTAFVPMKPNLDTRRFQPIEMSFDLDGYLENLRRSKKVKWSDRA